MSSALPFRVASWVPVVGLIAFIQTKFPETVLEIPGYTQLSILDFFKAVWELLTLVWNDHNLCFLSILFLRYFRLVLNLIGYLFFNEPIPIPRKPTVKSRRAHVIIPSVEPTNDDFMRCIQSVLEKRPGWITVVTANQEQTAQAQEVLDSLPPQTHTRLAVTTGPMANKRHQVAHVLRRLAQDREANKDVLVVFVDDHVWWPSPKFLSAVLAPFENPKVGIVGMHKRPERARGTGFTDSVLNFIACLYLERHNFEVCSSNAIDGSAFVISGRTCVIRASIVMDDDFINGFVDEWFFFRMFGPLNPDDDNYITRYIIRKGWEIKWQNQPEALMQTSLGVTGGYKKFYGQLQRWARSQWRSNPCSVFTDRSVWRRGYIWGGILHLISFINFALVWDSMIVHFWYHSRYTNFNVYYLVLLIFGSKFVKVAPFFYHNPQDLWLFPIQVLFGYFHSFVKLWALLTFYDHSWSGRNLAAIATAAGDDEDRGNDDGHRRRRSISADVERRRLSLGKSKAPNGNSSARRPSSKSAAGTTFPFQIDLTPGSKIFPGFYDRDAPVFGQSNTSTPWGNVRATGDYLTPANVRESQYKSSSNGSDSQANAVASLSSGDATSYRNSASESRSPRSTFFHGSTAGPAAPFWARSPRLTSQNPTIRRTSDSDNWFARGRTVSRDTEISNGMLAAVPQTSDERMAAEWADLLANAPPINQELTASEEAYLNGGDNSPSRIANTSHTSDVPRRSSIRQSFIKITAPSTASVPARSQHSDVIPSPTRIAPRSTYARQFPRGYDCLRTHPDGSHLSVPSGRKGSSSKRRCRSPSPSWYPVVDGHPKM